MPDIAPASTALKRVAAALDVNVRQVQVTPQPGSGLLAAADIQPRTAFISRRLQCVPFARERSGVAIRGNANTWWKQAAGSFVRVKAPAVGAVVVMNTRRGHVGVVTKIVDKRTVIIDHSNWLSSGQIYLDQPVMDVSANNDWSKVVVWHPNLGKYGKRALTVSGFIVDAPARGNSTVYASLADVPASMAGDVQYAEAVINAKSKAAGRVKAPVAAPTLVADAGPVLIPQDKPVTLTAATLVASAEPTVAAVVKPNYVDVRLPAVKPTGVTKAAPALVAEAKPVYVDMIVPGAKPKGLTAPALVASAKASPSVVAAADAVYVDTIVPGGKPVTLGAAAVAVVKKGETGTASATETAFIPVVKPTSVATFR